MKLPCRDAEREGDFTAMQRWLFLLFLFAFLPAIHPAENPTRTRSVIVLPIRGQVNESQFFILRRTLKNAENIAAAALILDMDSAGGDANAAAKIEGMLRKSPVPAYTYVNPKTKPAGPWIAFETKKVFTAPQSASERDRAVVCDLGGRLLKTNGVALDVADVANQCHLDAAKITVFNSCGWEPAAYWLVVLTPLLLICGFFGAYAGFHFPGYGASGLVSALCFFLFFASHYIAGLTGLEMPALFGLGVVFIFMESFLFRGVVVLALGGMALICTGIFFSMVDFYPAQPVKLSLDILMGPFFNMVLAVLGAVFAGFVSKRYLGMPSKFHPEANS